MNMQIGTCDGKTAMRITGGGTVRLVVQTRKNKNVEFLLTGVAYAPNSRCNLLSLPMLADAASIKWYGDKTEKVLFDYNSDEIAHAPRYGQLYHFKVNYDVMGAVPTTLVTSSQRAAAAAIDWNDPVWHKHRCFGHLSFENMRKLLKISEGMGLTNAQIKAKMLEI
jgi:hypothetical protein